MLAFVQDFLRRYRFARAIRHAPGWLRVIAGRRHYDRDRLERIFRDRPDPWHYEGTAQSAERRDLILAHLPRPRYATMLEVGCAEGWLTAALAERSDAVTSIDISTVALTRARARCVDLCHVTFLERDIITEGVPGPFEVVVCAGVLRYVPRPQQNAIRAQIISSMVVGGDLLLEHKRDADPGEISGSSIHAAFQRDGRLEVLSQQDNDCYSITVFRRRL